MSNVCVYSYADASGVTKYVDDNGDYYFTGTWSSGGTYTASPLTAVQYGAAMYMCIRDNIGDNPQRVPSRLRPQSWSIASLLYEYQCGGGGGTAESAWELAQIGTNTGSAAYNLAGSAYDLAESALNTANGAFDIAVAGTEAANQALGILSVGWPGTVTVWASQTENGSNNVELIFVNGILQTYAPA